MLRSNDHVRPSPWSPFSDQAEAVPVCCTRSPSVHAIGAHPQRAAPELRGSPPLATFDHLPCSSRRRWSGLGIARPQQVDCGHLRAACAVEQRTPPPVRCFTFIPPCSSLLRHQAESSLKLATYLPSPPASPSSTPTISTSLLGLTRARLACPRPSLSARLARVHKTPYSSFTPTRPYYKQVKMSQRPYANWPAGVKTEAGLQSQADAQRRLQSRSATGMRSHSSSTSSLSGAMGDAQLGVQPRTSVTPPSGLASWTPPPASGPMSGNNFMAVPGETTMSYLAPVTPNSASSPSGAFATYSQYNLPMYSSPETSPGYAAQFGFAQDRGHSSASSHAAMMISPSSTPAPMQPSRSSGSPLEDENRLLQQRIQQLELVNQSSRRRIKELEKEVSHGVYPGGLPSPMPTPHPPATFEQEWRARTEARQKLLCSLNRAGNALCAWHDSRRERRTYPPRMAPAGYLNCGCTYEEALFEESLSRHGVGSYLPGESVRMDPALRNPLLRLLQQRYGYRDGDFERDPVTGNWIEGEGAAIWEQKVASGANYSRRNREADRRSA